MDFKFLYKTLQIFPEYYVVAYQHKYRVYLDEYKTEEPEIETDNFFYERFMRRK